MSSFGIGGTNAHVVLEEAPPQTCADNGRDWQLILLSAKSGPAPNAMAANLAAHLQANLELNLADVAFVLASGRWCFPTAGSSSGRTVDEAVQGLDRSDEGTGSFEHRPVTFMFSGQGAQYVDMGGELYRKESLFRRELDQCAEMLEPHLRLDLRRPVSRSQAPMRPIGNWHRLR